MEQLSHGHFTSRPSALLTSPSVWSNQHHPSSSPPPPAAPSGSSSAGVPSRAPSWAALHRLGEELPRWSGGLWHPSAASSPCRRLCPLPFQGAADEPLPGDLQRVGFWQGIGAPKLDGSWIFEKNTLVCLEQSPIRKVSGFCFV